MTASDRRLESVYEKLTAKERALMRVRWAKEGIKEPPSLYKTTPPRQIDEVNRVTELFGETSTTIGWYVFWLQSRLEALSARLGTVAVLRLWSLRNESLRELLVFGSGEPVTRTEYAQRLAESREELVPVSDGADFVAERELEAEDLDDREYHRRRRAHERRLRQLVDGGQLASAKPGRRLCIPAGVFYDWLGGETPVPPEMGAFLDVLPDETAVTVARMRSQRAAMMDALLAGPVETRVPDKDGLPDEKRPLGPRMAGSVAANLSAVWSELLALECVVVDVAADLDGEEPIHPGTREMLEGTKATAAEMADQLRLFVEGFALPDIENATLVEALLRSLRRASESSRA